LPFRSRLLCKLLTCAVRRHHELVHRKVIHLQIFWQVLVFDIIHRVCLRKVNDPWWSAHLQVHRCCLLENVLQIVA
jgi:hypothetical protein